MRRTAFVVLLVSALGACGAHDAPPPPPKPVTPLAIGGELRDAGQGAAPAPPTLRLPDDVEPVGYELTLEVDPDRSEFRGEVTIRVRVAKATDRVYLHADVGLTSATWQQGATSGSLTPLDPKVAMDELRGFALGRTLLPGEATFALRYTGRVTDDEAEGLFRQKAVGRWYLWSQSESVFARRIVPCFDEPRWKVPWHVTLIAPKGQVALANTGVEATVELSGNRTSTTFLPTPPMPSYLLAIAIGPFEVVDAGVVGARHVPLRVAVMAGDRGRAAIARRLAPGLVAKLEAYFGSPLPWPKLDLVAIPRFFGAMENPGLITFDRGLLVGRDDDRELARRFTKVAAHELAHLWFGDWVTFAWWDDLWLAEAFASWMSDKVSSASGAFDDLAFGLASARTRAMASDDETDAHSLHRTIDKSSDADTRFDAISYEKGAAVLAMFERFAGESRFRTGVRAYVDAHRDGNATSADLFAAIAAATAPEVARAFTGFVEAAGVPVVELALVCDATSAKVVARARDAGRLIPVCLRDPHATACAMVGTSTDIPLAACPAWIAGNDDGTGYYRVATAIPAPPIEVATPRERIARGDDVASALARGELPAAEAFAQLATLAKPSDPYARLGALAIAAVLDRVVDDAARPAWTAWLAARFPARLLVEPGRGHAAGEVASQLVDLGAVSAVAA
ncbi:MAG: M1 family aminopeptidase, partial [Proteobacteria bacterium]|nr:M1 family aminopeptidase [Pseudomonadota bacterium]